MNLKKNEGYVGIDISVALIILLILVPIITGMIYNINKENNNLERKSQALNFAVNVMETSKGIELEELEISNLEQEVSTYFKDVEITNTNYNDGVLICTKDSVTYELKIEIKDYSEIDDTIEENKAKKVSVVVTYLVGGDEQSIDLSTIVS